MKRILAVTQAGLLAVAALAAGTPAAHAADPCLGRPSVGQYGAPGVAPLTTSDGELYLTLFYSGTDFPPDYCSGVTAMVEKADGTLRRQVAFTERGGLQDPPAVLVYGSTPIPLATGAGDWVVTDVSHGTESITVSVPFRVRRGTVATLEQPARVTSPAKTTVTGVVRHYTPTGGLAADPGRTVQLRGGGVQTGQLHLLGSTRTDATGRYRFQLTISAPVFFQASVDENEAYTGDTPVLVTAHLLASLSPLTASTRGYVGVWWRVSAKAFPTTLFTNLQRWDDTSWTWTQSFGSPAADGSFTRWWKPDTAGTFRLRVELAGSGPDNLPIDREVSPVTVTARPAYLTGTAGATTATVIRPGTKMSTYGHLTAMYTTGKTGPFAGQKVVVQTRPRGTTQPYVTVATTTTASTGYYYANWTIRNDVDVRVAFVSPYQSVGSAFTYVRAVDVR